MKKIVILILARLPYRARNMCYNGLWRLRKLLYKLQRFHPARLLALVPIGDKMRNPPAGIVNHDGFRLTEMQDLVHDIEPRSDAETYVLLKTKICKCASVFQIDLPSARVYGAQGAVMDRNNKLVADVSREIGRAMGGETAWAHSIFTKFSLGPLREVSGHVGLLCAPSSNTYFHWLFDVLPRVYFLQKAKVDCYMVGKYQAEFQKESLEMLGLDKPILQIGQEQVLVGNLSCLTSINRDCFMPESIDFLRENLIEGVAEERGRRLFISRQSAKYRKLVHYLEIKEVLERWGIEEFIAEDYSFKEQVKRFQEADLVIAPHGSGLSNIVFCEPETQIIELFSSEYTNPLFCRLALRCGLPYTCAIDSGDYEEKANSENIIADIHVTAEQVEQLLNDWQNDHPSIQ